jgi:capsular exopolysaccharide synthesis family protein
VELKEYWRAIRQRWRIVLLCLIAGIGAAALLNWQSTPQYASTAQLFISTRESDTSDAYQNGLFASQRVTSYSDLVKTRKLAEQVAEELDGTVDPSDLRDAVEAEVVPETVNLKITATDSDPFVARDIAQAYAVALTDLVAELETPAGERDALIKASIVDNANVDRSPVSPQEERNLLIGFALGLLLGVGLAVLRDLLDTSVNSADDIASVTDAPVLGHIARDKIAVSKAPAANLAQATPWAESFRVLRTNMQYVDVDKERKVFTLSSSLEQEGKSTTAVNLAVTLSMAGQRVALVECDLRRPLIAKRLGLDNAIGTTSVLIGSVLLDDALQRYADTDLMVLACGQLPPNPSELLQSHAMELLLKQLRDRFDIVLLDAPPLLPVTDAALLSARSDGLLMVLRHGKTTKDQLRHSLERVEQVGGKCVGVVVNLVRTRKTKSAYGYGYGYSSEG